MMKAKIERIGYTKIIEVADKYLETKKATNIIDSLSPKSIKINNYGVYIKLDGFFVQEDGIFISKKDNEKTYSKATDPSYTKQTERLYWYHAAG